MKVDKSIVITAIVGLVIIETLAMYFGINGTLRTAIVAIIAAAAGLGIDTKKIIK